MLAPAALAQSHRGALGLTAAAGGEFSTLVGAVDRVNSESGLRIPLELGGTLGVTDRSELTVSGRFSPGVLGVSLVSLSFYAGLRQSFGYDRWKTFFDLQAAVHALPVVTLGARVGFGVQYDFADIAGVYAAVAAQLGGLLHLRFSAEVVVGLQFRTYLFE